MVRSAADEREGQRYVLLSESAYAVLCGLIAPASQVDSAGIMADEDVWDLLRERFPVAHFFATVPEVDEHSNAPEDAAVYYNPRVGE